MGQKNSKKSNSQKVEPQHGGGFWWKPVVLIFGVLILAAAAGLGLMASPTDSTAAAASAETSEIIHAVSDFETGQARIYEYASESGVTVRYMVVRDGDGEMRAALDACEACWRSRRGYTQDGAVMVCNNCGQRFPLERIGAVKGGCNPHPFPFEVEDGQVLIPKASLEEGVRFFNL